MMAPVAVAPADGSRVTYQIRHGSPYKAADARRYGEELDALSDRCDGEVTAAIIVDAAADPESPLHDAFTWDPTEAANKQRLYEARKLMRSIIVTHSVSGGGEVTIPIMANVMKADPPEEGDEASPGYRRVYVSTRAALTDEDLTAQLIEKATAEIQRWRDQFTGLLAASQAFARFHGRISKALDELDDDAAGGGDG